MAPDVQPGEWPITALAWSPDGRRLAASYEIGDTYSDGEVVRVLDAGAHHLGRHLQLYDYQRSVTGLQVRRGGGTRRRQPASWAEATPVELVERFDVHHGPARARAHHALSRQASPLLPMSGGRVLTASDGKLVIRDGAARTGRSSASRSARWTAARSRSARTSVWRRSAARTDPCGSWDLRSGAVRARLRPSRRPGSPPPASRRTAARW